MPYPVVHFLCGYMLTKKMDRSIEYLIIGLGASVVLDFDFVVGFGLSHRLIAHSLPFVLLLSYLIFIYYRKIKAFTVTFANCFLHLVLDEFATNSPVYWFEPFWNWELGIHRPFPRVYFYSAQYILTIIPVVFIAYRYIRYKEDPFEIVKYFVDRYGKLLTYSLMILVVIGFIATIYIAKYYL